MTTVLVMTILWLGTLIYIHKRTIPNAVSQALEKEVKPYIEKYVREYDSQVVQPKFQLQEDLIVRCIATINDIGKELDDLYADDGKKNKPTAESTLPGPKK